MNTKIIAMLQLQSVPILFLLYALQLSISPQGFEDIVAVLMAIVGILGAFIAFGMYRALRIYSWHNTWYGRIGVSMVSGGLAFLLLIVYARIA